MTLDRDEFRSWLHHYSQIPVFLPQIASFLTWMLPSTLFLNPVLFLSPWHYPETIFLASSMTLFPAVLSPGSCSIAPPLSPG